MRRDGLRPTERSDTLAQKPTANLTDPVIFFAALQEGRWPPGPVWLVPLSAVPELILAALAQVTYGPFSAFWLPSVPVHRLSRQHPAGRLHSMGWKSHR